MTFSNPQYDLHQTAPYIRNDSGHPISTAVVGGTTPVTDKAVLIPPAELEPMPPLPPTDPVIGNIIVQTNNANPNVGDTVTYSATNTGNANDVQYTFSAPGENFTGGVVTWANDGATTVTANASSATAVPNTATGTLAVTVGTGGGGPAPSINFTAFSSTSFADGDTLSSNSPYHFNGSPNGCTGNNRSPQLSWTVDDDTNVANYQIEMDDITNPWVHWQCTVPSTVTTMAESFDVLGAGGTFEQNSWALNGITGSDTTNGYGGPCPPGTQHQYRIRVLALDNGNNTLATSASITITA